MSKIVIRRALTGDTAAMREMTRDVWDGTDYLPIIWERWLYDAAGHMMAATLDGRLVGLQHVALMPDSSAWLEGIRVAEDVQGLGIGGRLLDAGLAWAQEVGCSAARLSTYSENPSSNRMARRAGFSCLGSFRALEAAPLEAGDHEDGVRIVGPVDWSIVREFLDGGRGDEQETLFYTEGWTAYKLTDRRLRLLLATGAVLVHGQPNVDALAIATASINRPALLFGLLQGGEEPCAAIARSIRRRAYSAGLTTIRTTLNVPESLADVLRAAGFRERGQGTMLLYELRF